MGTTERLVTTASISTAGFLWLRLMRNSRTDRSAWLIPVRARANQPRGNHDGAATKEQS